jgi:hypothetical protein
MKANFSPSGSQPDFESIWSCYHISQKSLVAYRVSILANFKAGKSLPDYFMGMRERHLEECFMQCEKELDYITCLQLLSAIEAILRLDFLGRVNKPRPNSKLDQAFQDIFKIKAFQVNLEEDILDNWKAHKPACVDEIGQLKQILRFRHWLAHGRYWQPSFPKYVPLQVYTMGKNLLDCLQIRNSA